MQKMEWPGLYKVTEWGHSYFFTGKRWRAALRRASCRPSCTTQDDLRVILLRGALGIVTEYFLSIKGMSEGDQDEVAILFR